MNLQQANKHIVNELINIYDKREAQNICNLLLENITTLTKIERLTNANILLTQLQQNQLNKALQQLLQHKPIQQILGYTWFYKNKFFVDESVLIPRSETEELVALILQENKNNAFNILDIGTGSGCIAISLKHQLPNATITAIDISHKALQIAKKNAAAIDVDINFIELDFLNEDTWKALPRFDLIVSNPPYITEFEKLEMRNNVLQYEPHLALFTPKNDVLIFYKKIVNFALTHLNTGGKIYAEINETLSIETAEKFINKGFEAIIIKDMQGKNRMIKVY